MIHKFLYRCFQICSDWTKINLELVRLINVFKNNGFLENFINNCFKTFLNNKRKLQEKLLSAPKKPILLQATSKFKKSLKGIVNCCKLQTLFKSQNKLSNNFHFKGRIPKVLQNLYLVSFIKFSVDSAMKSHYGECVRQLNVRIVEHIRISTLTRKKVKSMGSAVGDHLLLCNHSSFERFSVLTRENRKFIIELKKRLLTMRDKHLKVLS